jgi:hypothetical protein
MASTHSYTITLDNNKSEKEALNFLIESNIEFLNPDKQSRKFIMEKLNIPKQFSRAFDLIMIKGRDNLSQSIELFDFEDIILIELKTTKKKLPNLPKGFFFGATESEFKLATLLKEKYKFCFVSIHKESLSYSLLTLDALEKIIKTKRIQYQINL